MPVRAYHMIRFGVSETASGRFVVNTSLFRKGHAQLLPQIAC